MARQQAMWICGFPSNCRLRAPENERGGDDLGARAQDAGGKRPRYSYSRWQWALEPDLARLGYVVDQRGAGAGPRVCLALGLALVEPGGVWDGPLSPWPEGAAMQRMYHQQATDAYTAEVVSVGKNPRAQPLFLRRDGARGLEVAINLSPSSMVFQPSGQKRLEALLSLPGPGHEHPLPLYAVQFPMPVAELLLNQTISHAVLLARWTRLWPDFPSPDWHPRPPDARPPVDLSSYAITRRAAALATKLVSWAPAILDSFIGDSQRAATEKQELEHEVLWLRALAGQSHPTSQPSKRWSSQEAVLFFRAASCLKDLQSLPTVVAALGAAQLASEGHDTGAEPWEEHVHNKGVERAPSASTLRRLSFGIDAAAMLWERTRRSTLSCATSYGWADASPQGGRDWLLIKVVTHRREPGDRSRPSMADLLRQATMLTVPADTSATGLTAAEQEARAAAVRVLRENFTARVLPPTALGLKRANLAHKAAALVHSFALETEQSIAHLDAELASLVSFTTDLGVESGIPDFRLSCPVDLIPLWMRQPYELIEADVLAEVDGMLPARNVVDILPDDSAWQDAQIEPDGGEGFMEPLVEQVGPAACPRVGKSASHDSPNAKRQLVPLLKYAIPVPGLLHILSNALQDVTSTLKYWPEYKVQLNNLSAFLRHKSRLDLFVATCVEPSRNPQRTEARTVFAKHLPTLHEQRWGSVTSFIGGMLRLWPMLCTFWDRGAFAEHAGALEADSLFDAAALTSSLGDRFFRAYSEMLQSLQAVVVEASVWAEGCPCHPVPHQAGRDRRSLKRVDDQRQAELASGPCPLAGRRAPELAAGRLQEIIAELASQQISSITSKHSHLLDDNQCGMLVADFEIGRRHLEAILVVKLDHWRHLPWMLAGLAHDDQPTARSMANRCIVAFDRAPIHMRHQHHELSKKLLAPQANFRAELEAFAGGPSPGQIDQGLSALSDELREEVARLRFIPVVEREIEAKHAAVKHTLAALTRHGPARVSMGLRSHQLWKELSMSSPSGREVFYSLLDRTRVPSRAAAALGLDSHPLVTLNGKQVGRSQQLKILEQATYRCDLAAQFVNHEKVARLNVTEHEAERREAAKVQQKKGRSSCLVDAWIASALPAHLHQLSLLEDVRVVLSLPMRLPDAVLPGFRNLADSLAGRVRT